MVWTAKKEPTFLTSGNSARSSIHLGPFSSFSRPKTKVFLTFLLTLANNFFYLVVGGKGREKRGGLQGWSQLTVRMQRLVAFAFCDDFHWLLFVPRVQRSCFLLSLLLLFILLPMLWFARLSSCSSLSILGSSRREVGGRFRRTPEWAPSTSLHPPFSHNVTQ